MGQRGISVKDVEGVLAKHVVVEEYPQETPFPERLLLGWIGSRPLHVLVAEDGTAGNTILVTVYDPDPNEWSEGFTMRKGAGG